MSCDALGRLFGLSAKVGFVLQFQGAAPAAHLQLGAVFAFGLHVLAVSDFNGEGAVPDFLPRFSEDVSEAFEVALARVNVTVWPHAHVYHGCGAGFDA
jgi:hypothetical protein